jgi:ATP-dependent Lhr-like helicase
LLRYLADQMTAAGVVPDDRTVVIERFRDEIGDWRVCVLSPFGSRIHAPWAMALRQTLGERSGFEVQVMYTDDGIVVRFADAEDLPGSDVLVPDPEEVEDRITAQLGRSALFAGLFRENAARSLLIPRRRPDQRNPLWAQRIKAQNLLAAVQRYPGFPIVLETYRQALADVFDLPGLKALLHQVRSRQIQVVDVETPSASPFARSLVFAYVAAHIYEQDAPLAERRAQALTLDRHLLAELLGHTELRDLIDPLALAELEADLQHLAEDRRARDAEELHDLLRRLGDLAPAEIEVRSAGAPGPWLDRLLREQRAVEVTVAGERRWIAAEDAGLYRDALGAVLPAELPAGFLAPPEAPLEQLTRRYARTRGPFQTGDAARRFGILPPQAEPALRTLEAAGTLVRGEIRPGGAELDWCDTEVLRRLKRLTLARLRRQVAPVDAAALGTFLPAWQGVGDGRQGSGRLEEAIARLEGLALPWSELASVILPRRVSDFSLDRLDLLSATGRIVWVGRGPLGSRDGSVALYRRERVAQLLGPLPDYIPPGAIHATILRHLEARGASFLVELELAVQNAHPEAAAQDFRAALWDLAWAGRITNDTFAPLRSLGRAAPEGPRARRRIGYALAGGRWSRVEDLTDPTVTDTERTLARATMLLDRYGVVSRETALAESLPGGFGPVYRALRAMEEAGRVRRGYFVEGLSGAQFAQDGVIDRLRAARPEDAEGEPPGEGDTLLLPAVDPSNPYGAILPWPQTADPEARPRRVPGAWLVLVRGRPALYLAPGGRHLFTFPSPEGTDALGAAFQALHRLPGNRKPRLLTVERVDGLPVRESPHHDRLHRSGFRSDYRGLTLIRGFGVD